MKTQQRSEERLVEAARHLASRRGDRHWVVGARGAVPLGRTSPQPAGPPKWLRKEFT
jgi:hypothetical protein